MLHGDCLTVTGKTLAENLAEADDLAEGQQIIRPIENPIKPTGHLTILRGNLAPEVIQIFRGFGVCDTNQIHTHTHTINRVQ